MSRAVTVFPSAARIVTVTSKEITMVSFDIARGVWLFLDITDSGGTTPTLDVILQRFDVASGTWVAIPGAVFGQETGVATAELTVYPTMTAAANDIVKEHIGDRWRSVATIAGTTPTFTFSLGGQLLY